MSKETGSEMYEAMKEKLFSAVIADALDACGYRDQILRHDIRPLFPDAVVVGRALTVLSVDVYEIPDEPYKLELEAVDALKAGDVLVAQTNGTTRSSLWGELLSTAAEARGARGAVIDGFTRDSQAIADMGFPLFVRGIAPYDSKGRSDVIAYNTPSTRLFKTHIVWNLSLEWESRRICKRRATRDRNTTAYEYHYNSMNNMKIDLVYILS